MTMTLENLDIILNRFKENKNKVTPKSTEKSMTDKILDEILNESKAYNKKKPFTSQKFTVNETNTSKNTFQNSTDYDISLRVYKDAYERYQKYLVEDAQDREELKNLEVKKTHMFALSVDELNSLCDTELTLMTRCISRYKSLYVDWNLMLSCYHTLLKFTK